MKSLFTKFLFIFLAVIIISFSILIVSLNGLFESHFLSAKYEEMLKYAESIQDSYQLDQLFKVYSTQDIEGEIKNLERYFGATIWMVSPKGYIYITSEDENLELIENELNVEEIAQIFDGKTIMRKGHYSTVSSDAVITVAYPIYNIYNEVDFALFMHVPVPEVVKAGQGLYQVALVVLIGVLLTALGIIFVFTRHIINDIHALKTTVEAVSIGQYSKRHQTKRKDEIGQLSECTNQMAESLQRAELFRKNFISDLSHDFRSPLTNILGYSQGILDGTIEDYENSIKIIRDESRRLLKLSDGILSLTDLDNYQIDLKAINIEAMLLSILDSQEIKILEKALDVQVNFPQDRSDALGDEALIQRVLHNLIDNAIKFSPEGGRLNLDILIEDEVKISIGNDFIGEIDLEKIWHRFSKGDVSRGQVSDSFGLGLNIVQEILMNHHTEAHVGVIDHFITFDFSLKKA